MRTGDYRNALTDMSKVIKAKPQDADAYFSRAFSKMHLNNPKGAIQDYNNVLKIDSTYTEAYYYRGVLNAQLNKEKEACADWQKAAEFDDRAAKLLKKHCK